MRTLAASLALCASSGFAAAQGTDSAAFAENLQIVKSCVEGTASAAEVQGCVNITFHDCGGAAVGAGADAAGCNPDEVVIWSLLYSDALSGALDRARAADHEAALGGSRIMARVGHLLSAEAAWQAYRASQCRLEMIGSSDGAGGLTAEPLCQMRLFADRVFFLRHVKF